MNEYEHTIFFKSSISLGIRRSCPFSLSRAVHSSLLESLTGQGVLAEIHPTWRVIASLVIAGASSGRGENDGLGGIIFQSSARGGNVIDLSTYC